MICLTCAINASIKDQLRSSGPVRGTAAEISRHKSRAVVLREASAQSLQESSRPAFQQCGSDVQVVDKSTTDVVERAAPYQTTPSQHGRF